MNRKKEKHHRTCNPELSKAKVKAKSTKAKHRKVPAMAPVWRALQGGGL